jgi:hypothetical protein
MRLPSALTAGFLAASTLLSVVPGFAQTRAGASRTNTAPAALACESGDYANRASCYALQNNAVAIALLMGTNVTVKAPDGTLRELGAEDVQRVFEKALEARGVPAESVEFFVETTDKPGAAIIYYVGNLGLDIYNYKDAAKPEILDRVAKIWKLIDNKKSISSKPAAPEAAVEIAAAAPQQP